MADVHTDLDQAEADIDRYQREARDSARHAGRLMRLTAQLHQLITGMPDSPHRRDALDLIAAEADRSPWLAAHTKEHTHG